MELQKGAEDSQNKEKVNDFHEVIMPQKPKNTKLKNKMTRKLGSWFVSQKMRQEVSFLNLTNPPYFLICQMLHHSWLSPGTGK